MKNVLVVSGSRQSTTDRTAMSRVGKYLSEVNGKEDYRYQISYLDDLCYVISPGNFDIYETHSGKKLNDIDIVHIQFIKRRPIRGAFYLSRYCNWLGIACYYDYSLYFPEGKAAQAVVFLEHGVNFLKTIYTKDNLKLISFAANELGYPFILKANIASHGDHNYLIENLEQAYEVISKDAGVDFLAQQYCPNDWDYRLLLVGDDHLLFERIGEEGSHLNNTSKGAETKEVFNVLPPEIIKQSRGIADYLRLKIAGVDIMPSQGDGQYYFIEVNAQPQLRTGALTERKKQLLKNMYESLG